MKIYTIVAGVNGVGKSSFSGALKAGPIVVENIVVEDEDKAEEFILKELSFTQETTLSGAKTEKP